MSKRSFIILQIPWLLFSTGINRGKRRTFKEGCRKGTRQVTRNQY